MVSLLDDPMVQSAVLPLCVSLVLGLCIARVVGRRLAATAVPIAWAVAHAVTLGVQQGWPRTNDHRLFWLAAIGLVVGVIADAGPPAGARPGRERVYEAVSRVASRVGAPAGAVLAVLWIAWSGLRNGSVEAVSVAVVAAIAAVALGCLVRAADRDLEAPLILLVAAAALAPIALFGGSAKIAQLCGAVAAATGGFLLLNFPRVRLAFGQTGICGIGLPLVGALAVIALYLPDASKAALGVLALAFAASELARRVRVLERIPGPFWNRLAFLALCAIPAFCGAAVAYALFPGEPGY
jgi:hypothetical protein